MERGLCPRRDIVIITVRSRSESAGEEQLGPDAFSA